MTLPSEGCVPDPARVSIRNSSGACAASASAEWEFLPEIGVRLQASRYLPSEVDLVHEGWIGANAGLARFGETTAYLAADVETILGNARREFEVLSTKFDVLAPELHRARGGFVSCRRRGGNIAL